MKKGKPRKKVSKICLSCEFLRKSNKFNMDCLYRSFCTKELIINNKDKQ